jgi:hypothetical protein
MERRIDDQVLLISVIYILQIKVERKKINFSLTCHWGGRLKRGIAGSAAQKSVPGIS